MDNDDVSGSCIGSMAIQRGQKCCVDIDLQEKSTTAIACGVDLEFVISFSRARENSFRDSGQRVMNCDLLQLILDDRQ